ICSLLFVQTHNISIRCVRIYPLSLPNLRTSDLAEVEKDLLDLAFNRDLVAQKEILRDLLGDGRGAFGTLLAHVLQVCDRRADDAAYVDAAMLEERLVLGGDERVDDEPRHNVDGHEDAPLLGELAEQLAVAGIDPRDDRRLVIGELTVVGQIAAVM